MTVPIGQGSRAFEIAATTLGVQATPPNATMDQLGLPRYTDSQNPGRLYSQALFFHNAGDDWIEVRTSVDEQPASAGAATLTRLRLAPGDGGYIPTEWGDANHDLGYGTHQFWVFADNGTQNVICDPR